MGWPDSIDTATAALKAVRRGWHVFPLTPGGKKPLRGFTDWESHASNCPETIATFWHRPYNIGVACGPSRLVVIDLDMPKPGEQPAAGGEQGFRLLCEKHGQPYPGDTLTVRTRRGGMHLYYQAPEGVRLSNTAGQRGNGLGRLIDTRASGGYVVGPGSYVSQHDGTGSYTVIRDVSPAPLPAWLVERLAPVPPPLASLPELLADLPAHRLTRYGEAALRAETDRVTSAPPGGRNYALNLAAFNLGQLTARNVLPEDLVTSALARAAELADHRHPNHDPNSPREIAAVIASGLAAGMRAQRRRRRAA
ncbi:bifunctional DNA primase/polymerase [Nonomuraea sp. NPDC050536]|uniref:bifunctional DNA primase/polymerase n=1 Tax=Nonomuraea sp. NPDC050536 TaxID=3364366 RepID=UPI0037C59C3B